MLILPIPFQQKHMITTVEEKRLVGRRAAEEVREGMLIGLGSGSTAAEFVRALGEKVRQGLKIEAVSTSLATESLARTVGIPVRGFESVLRVDLTVDGVDEIDNRLRAIKGGGGALLREKVVAAASDRMIAIADSTKLVPSLGRFPLPIEVLPFAASFVESELRRFGGPLKKRTCTDGTPYLTDQQAYIFDLTFGSIDTPEELAASLSSLPGVLEHGLFLREIDELLVATGDKLSHIIRDRS